MLLGWPPRCTRGQTFVNSTSKNKFQTSTVVEQANQGRASPGYEMEWIAVGMLLLRIPALD